MSEQEIKFIHDNYLGMSQYKMAERLDHRSVSRVRDYCKKNKLYREKKMLSEADKNFIRNNYKTMKEVDICKVLGLKHRFLLQQFKQEEGLAKYKHNLLKAQRKVDNRFFNVNEKECWVA